MYNKSIEVPETYLSIQGPVVDAVMEDLLTYFGIPRDVDVIRKDNITDTKQESWAVGIRKAAIAKGITDDIIYVTPTLGTEEDIINNPFLMAMSKPVIDDPVTKIRVFPIYVKSIIAFKIHIRSKSRTRLDLIKNKLEMLRRTNREITYHTIPIMYGVHDYIKALLLETYYIKGEVLSIEETFLDFLSSMVDNRFTVVSNVDATPNSFDFEFKELRSNVIGSFKNDLVDLDIGYSDGMFEMDVEYEIKLEVPRNMRLEHPAVVYNQVLPEEFTTEYIVDTIPSGNSEYINQHLEDFTSWEIMTDMLSLLRGNDNYIRVPAFDVHRNLDTPNYLFRLFSVLTTITNTDNRFLLNLKELGDIELAEDIVAFLENGEYQYITTALASVFNVELYENDVKSSVSLEVDSDLNVFAVTDLDITKSYRVIMSYVPHGKYLNGLAIQRLRNSPDMLNKVIRILEYSQLLTSPSNGTLDSNNQYTTDMYTSTDYDNFTDNQRYNNIFISTILTQFLV